ncbi:MAG: glycosyltransferase family 2 protein [Candidatus Eremiobacteraeota bacterium]|nr:glycosyltransferase family 2 protein [Candidatus Eremiobacteraeota bacterium]
MSEATPRISVVIETLNLEMGPDINLPIVVGQLEKQSYPVHEIIVMVDTKNPELIAHVRDDLPQVQLVEVSDSTYFTMKDEGARLAKGDVVAMLDSDCVPSTKWAESIAARIQQGADAVGGRTRYDSSQPFSTVFNFFNFGYIHNDSQGLANSFLPNNVAFRREVYLDNPYDLTIRRSGAAHILCQQLKSRGYNVLYEPGMSAIHNSYGIGDELLMRVKSGYDVVNLSLRDGDGVMKETRHLRRGHAALLVIFLGRLVFDVRQAFLRRRDFELSYFQIPGILVASLCIRSIEMVSAFITMLKPSYFQERYGW